MQRRIPLRGAGGRKLAAWSYLEMRDKEGASSKDAVLTPQGDLLVDEADLQDAERIIVVPREPGFWRTVARDVGALERIECPAIKDHGPSWWHDLLGAARGAPGRGKGVKIGVVDVGFEPDAALDHVRILNSPEPITHKVSEDWDHGEAVCRLLGDRAAPGCCEPIAPGAELYFADAAFTDMTEAYPGFVFPVEEDVNPDDFLDPRLVSAAIYELTFAHEVDLINLSLGTFYLPDTTNTGLGVAITAAVSRGVAVVCAAGNEHRDKAAYPAVMDECLGVGAYGVVGWGPYGSVARDYHQPLPHGLGRLGGREVFLWPESAYGAGVDTLGPGVGILVARDGRPAFDVSGTSFAAPIVTGLLAVELAQDTTYLNLPRDRERSAYVRRCLAALCARTGMAARFEGQGVARLNGDLT